MLTIIHNFVWKRISVKCMEGEYITLTHLEVFIVQNKENFYFEEICFFFLQWLFYISIVALFEIKKISTLREFVFCCAMAIPYIKCCSVYIAKWVTYISCARRVWMIIKGNTQKNCMIPWQNKELHIFFTTPTKKQEKRVKGEKWMLDRIYVEAAPLSWEVADDSPWT